MSRFFTWNSRSSAPAIASKRPKQVVKEIAADIFLTRTESDFEIVYELDVSKYSRVDFKIDFSGSSNLRLATGGYTHRTVVRPYEKREVARLVVMDPSLGWQLSVKYTWEEQDPGTTLSGTPKKQEISKDIFLYTTRWEQPCVHFTYELDVMKYKQVTFTIDFTGSQNFQLVSGGLKHKAILLPYQRKEVARLMIQDPEQPWTLKVRYSWEELEPESAGAKRIASQLIKHNEIKRSGSFNRTYVKHDDEGTWKSAHGHSGILDASAHIATKRAATATRPALPKSKLKNMVATPAAGAAAGTTAASAGAIAPWVSVDEFLGDLGLSQYSASFHDEAMDNVALLVSMAKNEESFTACLKELGVGKMGHRALILGALRPYV